ncbi:hypothetical protein ABVV53_05540 [Novosphingobium sp. RD2P27]|uniref:Uncharacterized protein n=1 Tax=Novosphingobium kalidii TaxID=3230299 RepID=A0ABV2CZA0_9SPHN
MKSLFFLTSALAIATPALAQQGNDESYAVDGYKTAGRSAFLGLRARM